jgi:hypothetical protein
MLPAGALVEVGGGTPAGAEAAGARAVARGARGLVSFGFAGGLDPALAAGALVVAEAVLEGVMRFEATPALAAALWAVRGLAPTRPRAAGFAAGLLAGSVGACGYALSCPEVSPAFVAVWYTLGIALTGALGAALGTRVLRW